MCNTAAVWSNEYSRAGEGGSWIIPVWQEPATERAAWKVSVAKDVERKIWMPVEKTNIPHVKFTHKGPKAGEGSGANEVYFGQREQWSANQKNSWFT